MFSVFECLIFSTLFNECLQTYTNGSESDLKLKYGRKSRRQQFLKLS